MMRWTKTLTPLLAASLASILLGSCSSDSPTEPKPAPAPLVNPNKPSANARIQVQATLGDPAKGTALVELAVVDLSSCYFRGLRDNQTGVGRIGSTGTLQWFSLLPYTLREVLALKASAPVPSGLVVVGKQDTDNDGLSDVGYAWVFTSSGSLVGTMLFSSDSSDVFVNDVAAISDTVFALVGGERTPTRLNPLVAIVTLTAGGQLARGPQVVLHALSGRSFNHVAANPAGPSGGEAHLYASSSIETPTIESVSIHGLTAAFPAMTSWTEDWSQELSGAGPSRVANDIRVFEDRIYVAGQTDDAGKVPLPSNGGYWDSGLAARLTLAGVLEWASVIKLSTHSERFHVAVPTTSGIFFAGGADNYFIGSANERFGYGWITRVLPATGVVATNLTFGEDAFASNFNGAAYFGSSLYCSGYTNYELEGGGYKGWWTGIDVAGTQSSPMPALAGAPMPERAGDERRMGTGEVRRMDAGER